MEGDWTPGAEDRSRTADLRTALLCAGGLLALLHLVDLGNGTLRPLRSAVWCVLAVALYAVLHPPRVTAGRDWLAVRGLFLEHRVCTDLLVQVIHRDGPVTKRIVLRDALGNRVELDPAVLLANPVLWHAVDRGARSAEASGLLRTGADVLRSIARLIERDGAEAVFRASGVE
ncbi:hypothetical protein [Streptomyces sp. NPDC059176]|uniref:hypothetical protein n=1 Tax=unclassified Streptomyces TaxID=2593676 RepID=UPI0036A4705E